MATEKIDYDELAKSMRKLELEKYGEDSPPDDLVYHREISGYFSPSTGLRYLKAPGGMLREVTKDEWDMIRGLRT